MYRIIEVTAPPLLAARLHRVAISWQEKQ